MKTIFKILAIIGVLSFLGGLKNSEFFIFGLVLAGVFGYLGWKSESRKEIKTFSPINYQRHGNKNTSSNLNSIKTDESSLRSTPNNSQKNKERIMNLSDKSEEEYEIERAIVVIQRKINQLISGFEKGLLSENEFQLKKKTLEFSKIKLIQTYHQKQKEQIIFRKNNELFEELKKLKFSGLISKEEYISKEKQLRDSLLEKSKEKPWDSSNQQNASKRKIKKFLIYIISCLTIISVSLGLWWNSKWENHFDYIGDYNSGRIDVSFKGKSGFVDSSGNIVVPLIYDWVSSFRSGFANVCLNGKWGTINKGGKLIIPIKYDFIDNFYLGKAIVKINDKMGLVDSTGKVLISLNYDKIDNSYFNIVKAELKENWFFLDFDENITKHPNWKSNYDDIFTFNQGIARVRHSRKWGFVNKLGKEIIPLKYEYVGGFINGLARVELDSKWGVIDKSGNVIISIYYDRVVPLIEGYANSGLIECIIEKSLYNSDSIYFYMDSIGNVVKTETGNQKNEREFQEIEQELQQLKSISQVTSRRNDYLYTNINSLPSTNYNNSNYREGSYFNPNSGPAIIKVEGYYKANGTYVEPHVRTAPNTTETDNLRFRKL
jgi:hypothetical protein